MKGPSPGSFSVTEIEEARMGARLQKQMKICFYFDKQICSHPDLISSPYRGMHDPFHSCLSPQDHCTGMHSGLLEEFEYTRHTNLQHLLR